MMAKSMVLAYKKKIGLLQHAGGGNLGDDASIDAVMDNIRTRCPDAEIFAFTMNPADSERRHGIPSYAIRQQIWADYSGLVNNRVYCKEKTKAKLRNGSIFQLLRTINAAVIKLTRPIRTLTKEVLFLARSFRIIRSFDLLVVSGGGQLLDSWGGPWCFPYTLFKWIVLAKLSRVKCYFINVGAGPIKHPLSKYFVTRTLHLADYTSFRDAKSRAIAREVGVTVDADVFPDCVYSLNVPPFNTSRSETREKPLVGISPMAYCDPRRYWIQDLRVYEDFIRKLTLFASWLSHYHRLILFSTDILFDSQTLEDLDVALKNETDMNDTRLFAHEPILTTEALLSRLSSMDYIVTCRFHGVVFAHLMNIPVIAISHHHKVATLMTDLGLSEYCLDINTFDPELLATTFTRMVTDKEAIKARMAEKVALYKKALSSQFDKLFTPGATK
jgi:polysaccharide pyruvyl transferase WcaK-like protein